MTINGTADQFGANLVTGNYFDLLGVKPAIGRTFRPEEDGQPGSGPVVVLNHGLWERRFASDRSVIGQTVLVNGQGFTVIGVAPRGLQGTAVLGGAQMWMPMATPDGIFTGFPKKCYLGRGLLNFKRRLRA